MPLLVQQIEKRLNTTISHETRFPTLALREGDWKTNASNFEGFSVSRRNTFLLRRLESSTMEISICIHVR